MSFNPNIPISTDDLAKSFTQLRANFQAINTTFADNHIGLTEDLSISGMHKTLTMRPQTGDPDTTVDQVALYNKLIGGIPELFFRPNNNQTPIQLTYSSIKSDSTDTQYTFMAGPFIIYAGNVAGASDGQVVTLTPSSTLLYVDLTTPYPGPKIIDSPATPTNIAGTSFTIRFSTASIITQKVYYLAIGQ